MSSPKVALLLLLVHSVLQYTLRIAAGRKEAKFEEKDLVTSTTTPGCVPCSLGQRQRESLYCEESTLARPRGS